MQGGEDLAEAGAGLARGEGLSAGEQLWASHLGAQPGAVPPRLFISRGCPSRSPPIWLKAKPVVIVLGSEKSDMGLRSKPRCGRDQCLLGPWRGDRPPASPASRGARVDLWPLIATCSLASSISRLLPREDPCGDAGPTQITRTPSPSGDPQSHAQPLLLIHKVTIPGTGAEGGLSLGTLFCPARWDRSKTGPSRGPGPLMPGPWETCPQQVSTHLVPPHWEPHSGSCVGSSLPVRHGSSSPAGDQTHDLFIWVRHSVITERSPDRLRVSSSAALPRRPTGSRSGPAAATGPHHVGTGHVL